MQSPFPGMDPYLETPDLWPDVHHGLISQMRAVLNSALRPTYVARIALREYISDDDTLLDNEVKEARIEIRHVATRSVVTLIEILKHTNKAAGTQGQASFLLETARKLDSDANWVELDLLRAGLPSMTSEPCPRLRLSNHHSPRGRSQSSLATRRNAAGPLPAGD